MRRKLFTTLTLLCMTISMAGCSMLGTVERVEPMTSVNNAYQSQLNPTPVVTEDVVIMADETIPLEFDGPTWTELRVKYGLSVPVTETTTVTVPVEPEPVEQLDKTGLLETLAIEEPMAADDGNKYILLKGQWYLFDEENGVKAYVNNKCGALNFREGPSTRNKIYGSYKSKTELTVYRAAHMSDNSTWYYVKQANGDMGWQHSYYININTSEKVKPATVDILDLIKPTGTVEVTTIVNHDTSGHLSTRKFTSVDAKYLDTGYKIITPTRLWPYTGAGYTNDRIMAVEAGTELYVLGKAEMSNGLTWYRVKWQFEVDVVDTEETEHFERVEETDKQTENTADDKTNITVNEPDTSDTTTIPSWDKLQTQTDTESDREIIVNELLDEMKLTWSNAERAENLKDAGEKKIFLMLEPDTENVTNGTELRASWYNKLANVTEEDNVKAYNVYSLVQYNGFTEKNMTKICLVYELVEGTVIDNTEQADTSTGLVNETKTEEKEMVTVIKEYIGYIDYNVEKLLTDAQLRDMYGLPEPTATPTPRPTVKPTPTPKPVAKPTPKPTVKPTSTPTPTIGLTPTPTLAPGMVAPPFNSTDITANKIMKVDDVVRQLRKAGFSNIATKAKYYDEAVGQPEGTVYTVSIANSTYFSMNQPFYKDAQVVVTYYTRTEVVTPTPTATPTPTEAPLDPNVCRSPYDSSDFGSNAEKTYYFNDIEKAYRKAGFNNINVYADPYNPQIGQPEGMVYKIEIGGSTSFTTKTTYYKDTVVNIHYYTRNGISGSGTADADNVDKVSSPVASTVFTDNSNASQYLLNTTIEMFAKAGFTNISSVPVYYNTTIGQPEGMVKYIEIAGSRNFTLSEKFYKDAAVKIYYYTRMPVTPLSSKECENLTVKALIDRLKKNGFAEKNITIYGMSIENNDWLIDEYGNKRVNSVSLSYRVYKNGYTIIEDKYDFSANQVWSNDTTFNIYPKYDE